VADELRFGVNSTKPGHGTQLNPDFTAAAYITTLSTNGDSHVDLEIFKAPTVWDRTCHCLIHTGPDFGHTTWYFRRSANGDSLIKTAQGDLINSGDYTNGGTQALAGIRIWVNADSIAKLVLGANFKSNIDYTSKNKWPDVRTAWNAVPVRPF